MYFAWMIPVYGCVLLRIGFQFDKTRPVRSVRIYRVGLSLLTLPLSVVPYVTYFIQYDPRFFLAAPLPVWLILVWMAVLLSDILWQFKGIGELTEI